MSVLANLLALLSLDNSSYLQGIESSKGATSNFTGGLASIGGAVVVGGLTAAASAVTAVGIAAWDAGNVVDGAMDTISVATGATGEELAGLRNDFEEVFKNVPADADATAGVIGILNSRLDASGPALQNLAVPLLETSRLLGGDAVANAEGFSRVIGDWNIPLDQASGSLDTLFVASQKTGAPLDVLMERIVQYGAPLRGFGLGFEQSAALLSKWEAEGVNVETVMGGMRIAAGKFTKDGKDMATGLWDTVDAITNAESSTDALSIATEIFGAKAAVDLVDTIRGGKFDIDALTESMMSADGAVMDAAASTADWGEKWSQFKNKITVALAPIGEGMMDAAGGALEQVVGIFERPEVQQGLTTFATMAVQGITAVVTHIPPLINGLLAFITFMQQNEGIVVGILAALGLAATVWGVVTAAAAWTAMAPLLPVIAILALVAAGAYLLYLAWTNNFGGIQDKAAAVWAFLQPLFAQLTTWLKVNIPADIAALAQFWTGTLLPAITTVWNWINTNLVPLFSALINVWFAGLKLQITALAGFWQNVLLPAIQKFSNWMSENVLPVIQKVAEWLTRDLKPAFDGLSKGIQTVTGWLEKLAGGLNNLKLPDWLTPGSPTPWEIGLWGIGDAMSDLARKQLPTFNAELRLQPAGIGLESGRTGLSNAGGMPVVQIGDIYVDARGATDPAAVGEAVGEGLVKRLRARGVL